MRTTLLLPLLLGLPLVFSSCETAGPAERDGTMLGAMAGAGLGAVIGNNVNGMNSRQGAVAGAVVGGLVGSQSGRQRDEINTLRGQAHTTIVQVRNRNGSTTPVMLRQTGPNTWQGPRGETYNGFPTQEQLRKVYAI